MKFPIETWKWFGMPGHFIGASDCRFHMATRIGPWIVSSVGAYAPSHSRDTLIEIGFDRTYETMVFKAAECDCPGDLCEGHALEDTTELDMLPAKDPKTANANHMAMCLKWADIEVAP